MITGRVNVDREAVIRLQVHGPAGQRQEVEAVIDTGFNGFLVLPSTTISALGLTLLTRGRAILADGREEVFGIYEATVIWDGRPFVVEVGAIEAALVGMSLLYGHELRIHVSEGGHVAIEPFPGEV